LLALMLHRPASRDRQREQHRERARRHRKREKDGVIMVTLPVTPEQSAKLAALHYLTESELEDRARIGEAIGRMIDGIEIG
jgi:hypothetical protein